MINRQILGQSLVTGVLVMTLMGCDKKQEPIKATDAPAVQQEQTTQTHKSENDLYIERLNKDVKVENPDALLDEVNREAKSAK